MAHTHWTASRAHSFHGGRAPGSGGGHSWACSRRPGGTCAPHSGQTREKPVTRLLMDSRAFIRCVLQAEANSASPPGVCKWNKLTVWNKHQVNAAPFMLQNTSTMAFSYKFLIKNVAKKTELTSACLSLFASSLPGGGTLLIPQYRPTNILTTQHSSPHLCRPQVRFLLQRFSQVKTSSSGIERIRSKTAGKAGRCWSYTCSRSS